MSQLLRLGPRDAEVAIARTLAGGEATAYRHPLGFIHVALAAAGPWKDRLHVWSSQCSSRDTLGIHDHKFSFTSLVVAGAIQHQPYAVKPVSLRKQATHRLLAVAQGEEETNLVAGDLLVHATPLAAEAFCRGETYAFEAGRFHVSRNLSPGRSVTFVRARKRIHRPSSVLVPDLAVETLCWRRRQLDLGEVTDLLGQALADLATLEVAAIGATR